MIPVPAGDPALAIGSCSRNVGFAAREADAAAGREDSAARWSDPGSRAASSPPLHGLASRATNTTVDAVSRSTTTQTRSPSARERALRGRDRPLDPPAVIGSPPRDLPAYVSNGLMGLRVRDVPLRPGVATLSGLAGEDPVTRVGTRPRRSTVWTSDTTSVWRASFAVPLCCGRCGRTGRRGHVREPHGTHPRAPGKSASSCSVPSIPHRRPAPRCSGSRAQQSVGFDPCPRGTWAVVPAEPRLASRPAAQPAHRWRVTGCRVHRPRESRVCGLWRVVHRLGHRAVSLRGRVGRQG